MLTDNERWIVDTIANIRIMGWATLDDDDIQTLQNIAQDLRRLNNKCTSGCDKVVKELRDLMEDDGK